MSTSPKTILLVEDEVIIAIDQAQQLKNEGYAVVHAFNGQEAIAKVKAGSPPIDLILMDINLGRGLDGTEAAQIILQEHDIPIVFLSSHTEPEIVDKTEKITSYGYVVKNTGITVLAASIKMAFKLYTAHQTIRRTNESLRLAHAASYAGTWDWDIVANTFNWSPEFLKVFGMPAGTIAGFEAWTEALHPADREAAARRIQEAIDCKIDLVNDYRIVLPTGEIRWIRATGQTYYDGDRPLRMVGLCMDITASKQTEESLHESEAQLRVLSDNLPNGLVYQIDSGEDGRQRQFLYISAGVEQMHGISVAEAKNNAMAIYGQIVEEDRRLVAEYEAAALATITPFKAEVRVQLPSGETRWRLFTSAPRRLPNHHLVWDGVEIDITDRKQVEEERLLSEKKFARVFQTCPEAMSIAAIENGRYLDVNDEFLRITGFDRAEVVGRTSGDLNVWVNADDRRRYIEQLTTTGQLHNFETQYRMKSGAIRDFIVSGTVVEINGKSYSLNYILDITERKIAEEALKTSEERFRVAQEIALDAFTILQSIRAENGQITDFEWVYVNPTAGRILKYLPDQLVGQHLLKILPGNRENEAMFRRYARIVESNQGDEIEFKYDADGITGWFRNVTVKLGDGVAVSFSDITARKQAEEALRRSEARFRAFMDNSPAFAWAKDEQGRHIYLSRTYENYLNIKFEDWRGKTDFELWPPEIAQSFWKNDQIVLATNRQIRIEEESINPDGRRCRWLNFKFPFYDEDGRKCVGGIGIDITELKQTEAALQQALAEKEILMHELQHRVKNSLVTAASLLALGKNSLPNDQSRAILANTEARLHTMAALYDQLNQTGRSDRIDLRSYLQALVEKLAQAYLAADGPVKIETCLSPLELDPRRAMSLGLMVNELVTNALKYAFPAGRAGVIRVELAETADGATLGITDNGVGLASGNNKTGMGLRLAELLTMQLGGKLTIEGEQGVTVRVTFKK